MNHVKVSQGPAPLIYPLCAGTYLVQNILPEHIDQAEINDSTWLSNSKGTMLSCTAQVMHTCAER